MPLEASAPAACQGEVRYPAGIVVGDERRGRLVLVTMPFQRSWLDRLEALAEDLRVVHRPGSEISRETWQQVEVLYTFRDLPPAEAPRLRWVQLHSAGAEQVLEHPLFRAGRVTFTNTSGVHAIPIAEYVFAMVLGWYRRVPRMVEWQQRGTWPPDEQRWPLFVPEELWGRAIGIVGYGSIGRQVARLAGAFGMRVLATQRGEERADRGFALPGVGDPEGTLPERFFGPGQIAEMLAESDVVVLAVPLTPETRALLDERAFRAMKADALLVNVARAGVCDEAALVRALRERRIGAALLDVFHQEPLPPEHPLWQQDNVLMSPHVSGFTPLYDERALAIFEANLRRYLAGEQLMNIVDPNRGY